MRFSFLISQMLGYQILDLFQTDSSFVEFEKTLTLLRSNRFDGVELNLNVDNDVLFSRIERTIEQSDLKLAAIGTGMLYAIDRLSFTDPDPGKRSEAVSKVKRLVRFAAGHNAVVIIGLIRGTTLENDERMRAFRECLKECDSEADRIDGKIALEAINRYETKFLNTAEDVARFIEDSDLTATGMLLDTFHMNIEEKSEEETIRANRDKIVHFHIADSNRWPPGYGHLNIAGQVELLKNLGYQGWISTEALAKPSNLEAINATANFLRKNHFILG